MKLHPQFKFNGNSFTQDQLLEVGYSLIKEGEPYEVFIGDFLISWLNTSNFLTTKTSGSTGKPKPINLLKKHMVNSAIATGRYFNLKPSSTALLCIPAEYIAGKMMLVRAMVLGLEIDTVLPSTSPLVGINKKYDFCAMVPMQVQNSIKYLENLQTLIVGGAAFSNALKEVVKNKTTHVFETYGMTETITHVAVKSLIDDHFTALPNVSFSLDDRNCLVIDAPEISTETVVTNDLVELASKTKFKWLGRFDNVINSGGVKLIPEQIEAKLNTVIKHRFFVTGVADQQLGQQLVLIVEGGVLENEIKTQIENLKILSKFEIPKKIISIQKFIETGTGKIDKLSTLKALKLNS